MAGHVQAGDACRREARHGRSRPARRVRAGHRLARLREAGKARQGRAWPGRLGLAGAVWLGVSGQGASSRGRRGKSWHGESRFGMAGRGRQGQAAAAGSQELAAAPAFSSTNARRARPTQIALSVMFS